MPSTKIYLDSNATTQLAPEVLESVLPYLNDHFQNPSASYSSAREINDSITHARSQLASLLHAAPERIIFTSGGTESLNTAILSAWRTLPPERRHLIISATEHAAVLEPAQRWAHDGGTVATIPALPDGLPDLAALEHQLQTKPTGLVASIWANNETGVVSPVADITALAHRHGAMMLTDAVQAVGKLPIDVTRTPVDYLALSGHKFHAPKGIGALYISPRVRFAPLILGGGQENGLRSGTENVPYIVGLGEAAALMEQHLRDDTPAIIGALRDTFELNILSALPDTIINGNPRHRLPTTSSLTFPSVSAAEMLILLDKEGIQCSAGSACHTASVHPSHVLQAMGISAQDAASTLRFSFSRFTTLDDTMIASQCVIATAQKLRLLTDVSTGPVIFS